MLTRPHYLFCFMAAFLLLVFLPGVGAEEKKQFISADELQKITGLVENLKNLNEELTEQLAKSQTDTTELKNQLNELKAQVTNLQNMLETSYQEINSLKSQVNSSQKESQALLESLQAAQNSLTDLKKSVEATQRQLNSVTIQRNVSIIVAVVVLLTRFF